MAKNRWCVACLGIYDTFTALNVFVNRLDEQDEHASDAQSEVTADDLAQTLPSQLSHSALEV